MKKQLGKQENIKETERKYGSSPGGKNAMNQEIEKSDKLKHLWSLNWNPKIPQKKPVLQKK